jgi:hypothetical protein
MAQVSELKSKIGVLYATIHTRYDGRLEIRDWLDRPMGTDDPKRDESSGNLLATLVQPR